MFKFFKEMKKSTQLLFGLFVLTVLVASGFMIWSIQTGRFNTSADSVASSVILRPTSDYRKSLQSYVYILPSFKANWEMVNEPISNGDASYVGITKNFGTDLYGHGPSGIPTGSKISKIVVHAKYANSSLSGVRINIGNTDYADPGAARPVNPNWSDFSYTWSENPNTRLPWTLTDIDNLKFGAYIGVSSGTAKLTQVYTEVFYTKPAGTKPAVTTNNPEDVTSRTFSPSGTITSTGGYPITVRGFEVSKIKGVAQGNYPETGNFAAGTFYKKNVSLTVPNITYYVRAYATNTTGTSYGDWIQFNAFGPATIKGKTLISVGTASTGSRTSVIPGISVNLSNNSGFNKTVTSNSLGEFQFDNLTVGVKGGYVLKSLINTKFNVNDCVLNNASETTLNPLKGGDIIVSDVTLTKGLIMSGKLTDRQTGSAVNGGIVKLFYNIPALKTGWGIVENQTQTTASNGEFKICAPNWATNTSLYESFLQIEIPGYYSTTTPTIVYKPIGTITTVDSSWLKVLKLIK